MKLHRFAVGALLGVLCAGPVLAADQKQDDKAAAQPGTCASLPPKLSLDNGRYVLERDGDSWKVVKGSNVPRSFVYKDDQERKFIFSYWNNRQFRCEYAARQ